MKKRQIIGYICWAIALTSIITTKLSAQTFKAGIIAGMNFSQIDGDRIGGYTKVGINAGFMSEIALSKRWSLALELLYAQKGSASSYSLTSYFGTPFKIKLHYADIPLVIKYNDLIGGLTFGAGLSLGRIIAYQYEEDGADLTHLFDATDKIAPWDLQILGDLTYMFSPAWGINFRMAYSMLPIRKDCANSTMPNCIQLSNVLSLRTIFVFNALKQKRVIDND